MPNLVQAEFFHLGRTQDSNFTNLLVVTRVRMNEILSSVVTGVPPSTRIKTVVRFYDSDDILTSLSLESARIRSQQVEELNEFMVASAAGRVMIGERSKLLARKLVVNSLQCKLHAQRILREVIKNGQPLAVEKSDHTFRPARKDEQLELFEAASGSSSVWLFVFEPNDLLSTRNSSVASAM